MALSFKCIARVAALAALLVICGYAQAQTTLFAWDTSDENLYSLDTGPPPTATFIGGPNDGINAEIEFGGGVIFASDTGDNTNLHWIDPNTGLIFDTTTMTFPAEGNVITSMEFVGDTLYGGLTTEGGGTTFLSTIDPFTGDVTVIGSTRVGSPFGGLAYDEASRTMYGISAGGSTAELFTIDMGTGVASSVGFVTVDGREIGATALEFGDDGVLYSLPNNNSNIAGSLLSIDPATGNGINLGDTGVQGLVALTTPEPSSLALLGLVGLLVARRRAA